ADEVDLDGGDAEVHEDADTSEDADARVDGGDTELDADEVDLDGGDADSVDLDADAPTCEVFNEIWEGYIRAGAGQNVGGYIVSYLGEGGTDGRYTISCESSGTVIVENEVFADRETTVIEVPEDGKRIVLYPRTTNPGSADITITVENL
ncbi:hypothetical protein KKB44_00085, partial [Candidatus Micrarchaeota archaeon]|nr:hypothetical protein [Candidatus Micrarchaeota archaeon]